MTSILDCERLVVLRTAAGLSRNELAARLGTSAMTIRCLEEGTRHEERTLGFVAALAQQLGTSHADLLAFAPAAAGANSTLEDPDNGPLPVDDVTRVEAALASDRRMTHRDDIAVALDLTPRQVTRALDVLQDQLVGRGQLIQHGSWGNSKLTARDELLTADERQRLAHAAASRTGIARREGQVLHDAISDRIDRAWHRSASRADRVALATLLKRGLVTQTDGAVRPTQRLLFDLGLQEESAGHRVLSPFA